MIPVESFRGLKVAVVGLGGSGMVTAEALRAGGAVPILADDNAEAMARAAAAGFATDPLRDVDWRSLAALVLAPGVPLTHPRPHWSVDLALSHGVPILGDVELFCRERRARCPDAPLIAITGTNGKSTTTALIAHLLAHAGRDVQMGGNIGRAVLSLDPPQPGRHYVIECSSFQIDTTPSIDPTVGILLNLSEDHLDRHGTMANYAAIKERLVAGAATAIVGVDDPLSAAIADRVEQRGTRVVRISNRNPVAHGYYYEAGHIIEAATASATVAGDLGGIAALRGAHNGQNAAAAVAAVRALGLDHRTIMAGLRSFPGLAHRMELIGRRGRVLFVNDSKATNADSTAQALASFERIYWIAGGKPKTGGITSLESFFPRVAKAYLIGVATEEFADTLDGKVAYEKSGTVAAALEAAARDAAEDGAPESVVLLSPACASYDQFKNFEVRGDHFRSLVRQIDGLVLREGA
ncbi:UDP-N-acetylmuramoyl-L-alanine--D-glutamate ligase [Prosthecodimorpha staleyi]|uniref:UDP-N-acetylmuramoylalanine--D-glutamate ligase n=1 Tax=Prosthecodimorpha staleyi TaxID=2840188 RepID=A0A947GEF7_9HYPH|nr:UDP-N-acetylmuramoyl-L-alanine--D-glutamate ligase [Prosthecodimorpha staleyi]MBT9291381.1 UDP-N-acetylmuramoyl-L-alanine--D-glutamate ligase [Prosthecodimorpha staleyi]